MNDTITRRDMIGVTWAIIICNGFVGGMILRKLERIAESLRQDAQDAPLRTQEDKGDK